MAERVRLRRARSLAVALIGLALATSCTRSGDAQSMIAKTDWAPSPTAPREYPAFVVAGLMTLSDGTQTPVPSGRLVNGGWGVVGPVDLIGEEGKPAPVKLDLAWFSFIEDKFWRLSTDLPRDQLAAALRSGVVAPETGKPVPFGTLIVGMAPGGDVDLWISAGRVVRQVAMFHAAPADFPLEAVSNNPERGKQAWVDEMLGAALKPEELMAVREKPVPTGQWRAWEQRYAWRPQVVGAAHGDTLWVTTLNGEVDWFDLSGQRQPGTSSLAQMAAPKALEISWRGADGAERVGEVTFDPTESAGAFQAMAKRTGGKLPLSLIAEPADAGSRVEVLLRAGDELYRFAHTQSSVAKR